MLDRRSLVKVGLGIVGFATCATLAPIAAFADEGGGGGGEEGEGGGGGGDYSTGMEFIWFDRGGNDWIAPAQGWDDASITYFFELVRQRRGRPIGHVRLPSFNNRTAWDVAWSACSEALANARARSGQAHARIVGIGYWWMVTHTDGTIGWGHADSYRGFETLIKRAADASECTPEGGWDNIVEQGNSEALPNETWRNYIYRIGKVDNPGARYSFVAVAVANGEPPMTGFANLDKDAINQSWLDEIG